MSLVAQNRSFLILPHVRILNLGSRVLRLCLDRLSADWEAKYDHPLLVVETFVGHEQFSGTVYIAQGWEELGQTDGWDRCRRDFYVQHDKPKRKFVREVAMNARRSKQPCPQHKSLTDFQASMGEANLAKVFAFVTHRDPRFT